MKSRHLKYVDLPDGFKFPQAFIDLMSQDILPDIEPWEFSCDVLDADTLLRWKNHLKEMYPSRNLILLARVIGSDDMACFEGTDISDDPKVYYVHSFASPGWEDRGYAENFDEWLASAKEDSRIYKEDFIPVDEEHKYGWTYEELYGDPKKK